MWNVEMTRVLRHMIDDLSSSPTYSNTRLEETILVAAQLANNDVDFDRAYTIDVDELTLTPDPTDAPKDDSFIALVCLRATLLIFSGILKSKSAMAGLAITSGRESISTSGLLEGYKKLWEKASKDYEEATFQYMAGNRVYGRAILGPFSGEVWTGGYNRPLI
jgi:hypothetical protein